MQKFGNRRLFLFWGKVCMRIDWQFFSEPDTSIIGENETKSRFLMNAIDCNFYVGQTNFGEIDPSWGKNSSQVFKDEEFIWFLI